MIKTKILNKDKGLIDILVRISEKYHITEWNETNNIFMVNLQNGGKFKIIFPLKITNDFCIEGNKKGINFVYFLKYNKRRYLTWQ